MSNVFSSPLSSHTPHPCWPPPAKACQLFTSLSFPAHHGLWEVSLWLLCNNWMESQNLWDIPAPPQWHPRGQKVIAVEESASAVLSCLISFTAVLIPTASVYPTAQNSCKAMCIVCVVKWHLALPGRRPRSFSAERECLRAWLQAVTGCLCLAATKVNSVLYSQIKTVLCVQKPQNIVTLRKKKKKWLRSPLKVIIFSLQRLLMTNKFSSFQISQPIYCYLFALWILSEKNLCCLLTTRHALPHLNTETSVLWVFSKLFTCPLLAFIASFHFSLFPSSVSLESNIYSNTNV